jgi:hypothetical protein
MCEELALAEPVQRDGKGAINVHRLWNLSSSRPSSLRTAKPKPTPAPVKVPELKQAPPVTLRQPPQPAIPSRNPSTIQTNNKKRKLSRTEFWTIVAVIVALLTLIATVATPEIRRLIRLDKSKPQINSPEGEDVWNRLRAFPTVAVSDDLRTTRFSVVNDGNSDIASHSLFCHINSINYPHDVYFRRSHFSPLRFDKGPLQRNGDGESVKCLKSVGGTSPDCADVTIVVDYTLSGQPQERQEKTFRFATTKTQTGHAWDIQPLSTRIDYCDVPQLH